MGTDIHITLRVLVADEWVILPYCVDESGYDPGWVPPPGVIVAPLILRERCYDLFHLFYDICRRPDNFPPLLETRGLPPGFDRDHMPPDPEYPDMEMDPGDYGFTWATPEELRDLPWDTTMVDGFTARKATYNWIGTVYPWLVAVAQGRPMQVIIGFDN